MHSHARTARKVHADAHKVHAAVEKVIDLRGRVRARCVEREGRGKEGGRGWRRGRRGHARPSVRVRVEEIEKVAAIPLR